MHVHEPLAEHRLVVLAGGGGESEKGVTVVAGREGDDLVLAGLSGFDPVLTRELQGRLHCLRAARKEVQLVEIAGKRGGELGGELLDRTVGECRAGEIAELPRLARERVGDLGVRVAQVGGVGPAHRVEIPLAVLVVEVTAVAAHDPREIAPELPVEDVAVGIPVGHHPLSPFSPRGKLRRGHPPV